VEEATTIGCFDANAFPYVVKPGHDAVEVIYPDFIVRTASSCSNK
jgi:hypothetical protein